jgi:predicted nuclease with TOPRIM domain
MTVLADLTAITPTANAKSVVSAKGADLVFLITNAKQDIVELQAKLRQIVAHHLTGGGDAANLSALNAVLAQVA